MKATLKHYTILNTNNEEIATPGIITESQPFVIHLHINPNEFVHCEQLPYEMRDFIDRSYEKYEEDSEMMEYLTNEAAYEINRATDMWLDEEKAEFTARIHQQLRDERLIEDWTGINIIWTEKSAHYEPTDFRDLY